MQWYCKFCGTGQKRMRKKRGESVNTEERKSALKKLKALINGHWNGKKIIIHYSISNNEHK